MIMMESVGVMSKIKEFTGIKDLLGSLVKVSDLTKYTSKILEQVNKENKEIVIMKNNDPQGILLSIKLFNEVAERLKETDRLELELARLKEELENLSLFITAEERMQDFNPNNAFSREEMFKKYNIDEERITKLARKVEIK